uniref:Uncharacterized protein n=1 Tax=Octopus bimaculoides TaxID=37653 RepID=A0A0L8FH82_OCTBM
MCHITARYLTTHSAGLRSVDYIVGIDESLGNHRKYKVHHRLLSLSYAGCYIAFLYRRSRTFFTRIFFWQHHVVD